MKSVMFLILFVVAVLASHQREEMISNALEELLAEVLEAPEPASHVQIMQPPTDDDEDIKENLLEVMSSLKELAESIESTPGKIQSELVNQDAGFKKIGDFECADGKEVQMFDGLHSTGVTDNPGTFAEQLKACKNACLTKKVYTGPNSSSSSWASFGNTISGFIMNDKGRCYCEAASSSTCTPKSNGSYARYDLIPETCGCSGEANHNGKGGSNCSAEGNSSKKPWCYVSTASTCTDKHPSSNPSPWSESACETAAWYEFGLAGSICTDMESSSIITDKGECQQAIVALTGIDNLNDMWKGSSTGIPGGCSYRESATGQGNGLTPHFNSNYNGPGRNDLKPVCKITAATTAPAYDPMTAGFEKVCINSQDKDTPISPGPDYLQDEKNTGKGEWYYKKKGQTLQQCKDLCSGLKEWDCKFISFGPVNGYCYVHQKCSKLSAATSDVSKSQIYCQGSCDIPYDIMGKRGSGKVCINFIDTKTSPGDGYQQDGGGAGDAEWYYKTKGQTLEQCKNLCSALGSWGCKFISFDSESGFCYVHKKCLKMSAATSDVPKSQIYCQFLCPVIPQPTIQQTIKLTKLMNDIRKFLQDPKIPDEIKANITKIMNTIKNGILDFMDDQSFWDWVNIIWTGLWHIKEGMQLLHAIHEVLFTIHHAFPTKVYGNCMEKVCENCVYSGNPIPMEDFGSDVKCIEACQKDIYCAAVLVGRPGKHGTCLKIINYDVRQGYISAQWDMPLNYEAYSKKDCRQCMALQCKNCGFDGYSVKTAESDEKECNNKCLTDENCYGVDFDTELNACYFIKNKEFTWTTNLRANYNAYLKGKCRMNRYSLMEKKMQCDEYIGYDKETMNGVCYDECTKKDDCNFVSTTKGVFELKYTCHYFKSCQDGDDDEKNVWKKHMDDIININGEHQLDPVPSMYSKPRDSGETYDIRNDPCDRGNQITTKEECMAAAEAFGNFNFNENKKFPTVVNKYYGGCLYDAENAEVCFNKKTGSNEESKFQAVCRTGIPQVCPYLVANGRYFDENIVTPTKTKTDYYNCLHNCMKDPSCGGINHNSKGSNRQIRCHSLPKAAAALTYTDTIEHKKWDAWKRSTCYECMKEQCTDCVSVGQKFSIGLQNYDVCLQACRSDPECYGVDVGRQGTIRENHCFKFFKTSTTATMVSNNYDSWIKGSCDKPQQFCMVKQCVDCEFAGGETLKVKEYASVEDCKNQCLKDPKCVGIDVAPGNQCFFVDSINVGTKANSKKYQAWKKSTNCDVIEGADPIDCNKLPASMVAYDGEKRLGCPGAVYAGENKTPAKPYCSNDSGRFPWWGKCCMWRGDQEGCVPKRTESNPPPLVGHHQTCVDKYFLNKYHLGLQGCSKAVQAEDHCAANSPILYVDGTDSADRNCGCCINENWVLQEYTAINVYNLKNEAEDSNIFAYHKTCSDGLWLNQYDLTLQECSDAVLKDDRCKVKSPVMIKDDGDCGCSTSETNECAEKDDLHVSLYCLDSCGIQYANMGTVGFEKVCINSQGSPSSPGGNYVQDGGGAGDGEWYYKTKGQTLEQCQDMCSGLRTWGCKFISFDPKNGYCYVHQKCSELAAATSDVPKSQIYCQGLCPEKPYPCMVNKCVECQNLSEHKYKYKRSFDGTVRDCKNQCLEDPLCYGIDVSILKNENRCYFQRYTNIDTTASIKGHYQAWKKSRHCASTFDYADATKLDGTNHKCENTGNPEHPVDSLHACKSEALDNNAAYFSYYEGADRISCFWSKTCKKQVATEWTYDIYETTTPAGTLAMGDFECNGKEIRMFDGLHSTGVTDNPGTLAEQLKACKNACLTKKVYTGPGEGSWNKFGSTVLGFTMNDKGRCYCEAADSSTCTQKSNGSYARYDLMLYEFGVAGSICTDMEFSSIITDKGECDQAIVALTGIDKFIDSWHNDSPTGVTGGCSYRDSGNGNDNDLYPHFNSNNNGLGRNDLKPVCKITATAALGSYNCQVGQGEGESVPKLSQTNSNSESSCTAECSANSQCVGFDYTTKSGSNACRLYPANNPRLGEGGGDNRQYCAKAESEINSEELLDENLLAALLEELLSTN